MLAPGRYHTVIPDYYAIEVLIEDTLHYHTIISYG